MPMEAFSLSSTTIPSSLTRREIAPDKTSPHLKFSKYSHFINFPFTTTRPTNNRIRSNYTIRAQVSGSTKSSTAEGIPEKTDSKDDNLVFVAGATGKVGSRTVRELIKLGFKVRAGVRNSQRAGALIQSVKQLKLDGTSGGSEAVEKLEIVECDLEKPNQIGSAIGNASVVICTIGASEKEVFDITGPFRIDYTATKNLINAATVAKINHFILVTSLGTNKVGFPAAILNLFWGVLIWKRKAEEALLASGLPYTIVRPGGMERPTDAYKETHNVTLSTEDTLFGGQVSNLQVAELMAAMAKNRDLSYCKIVEVIAETTAPLKPAEELLATIPSQRPLPKKPDTTFVSSPGPSANIVAEVTTITPQEETEQPKPAAKTKQTLSPYAVYDDFKPPSSPSPSKPSNKKQISEAVPTSSPSNIPEIDDISQATSPSKKESLSPYAAYEDLKPPTSPTPRQSSSNDKPNTASAVVESVSLSIENNNVDEKKPSEDSNSSNSPYHVYADLKPPSSPSPNAPTTTVSEIYTVSSNGPAQLSVEDKPNDDGNNLHEPKSRPLSPYAMYEDLKPPASPSPSFRKS